MGLLKEGYIRIPLKDMDCDEDPQVGSGDGLRVPIERVSDVIDTPFCCCHVADLPI